MRFLDPVRILCEVLGNPGAHLVNAVKRHAIRPTRSQYDRWHSDGGLSTMAVPFRAARKVINLNRMNVGSS